MKKNRIYKKAALFLAICILAIFTAGPAAYAQESPQEAQGISAEELREQVEASGASELFASLPEDIQALMQQSGVTYPDFDTIYNISPKQLITMLTDLVGGKVQNPLRAGVGILGVLFLFAILQAVGFDNEKLKSHFSLCAALFIILVMLPSLSRCISGACSAIEAGSNFMFAFLPVLTAIIAAKGNPAAALSYNSFIFVLCEALAQFSKMFLAPFAGIFLGLNMICPLSKTFDFSKISDLIKKTITVILGLGATIFTGLLTTKGVLAKGIDTVAMKSAKFVMGAFVPVIGGSLGDAFGSIMSGLSIVKNTVGIFGILAVVLIHAPVLVELLLWLLCLHLCAACAEALGQGDLAKLLKGIGSGISILNILVIFDLVMLVVSTAIMLMIKADV